MGRRKVLAMLVLAVAFGGVIVWLSPRPPKGMVPVPVETPPIGFVGLDCGGDPVLDDGAHLSGDYVSSDVRSCFRAAYVAGRLAEMRTFDGSVWRVTEPERVSIWWPSEKTEYSLMWRWRTLRNCRIEPVPGFVQIWVLQRNGSYRCEGGTRLDGTFVGPNDLCAADPCPHADFDDHPSFGLCTDGPVFHTGLRRYDDGNVFAGGSTVTAAILPTFPIETGAIVTLEDTTIELPDDWAASANFRFESDDTVAFTVIAHHAPVSFLVNFRLTGSDGRSSTISREILNTIPQFGCEWGRQ